MMRGLSLAALVIGAAVLKLRKSRRRVSSETEDQDQDPRRLRPGDKKYMDIGRTLKATVPAPMSSNFLCCCVMEYTDLEGRRRHVTGVNGETCVIRSSICSERAALLKLRLLPFKTLDNVYIICSSDVEIAPGVLCREYMSEVGGPDLRIVLFTDTSHKVFLLRDLYPHPPLYRGVRGGEVVSHAHQFAGRASRLTADAIAAHCPSLETMKDACVELFTKAVDAATPPQHHDGYYPLRYAAGVLLQDGSMSTAVEKKLVEYGCCVDPITLLIPDLERPDTSPVFAVLVDQAGVLHAPFAQARAFLGEYGFPDVVFAVHTEAGELAFPTVADLTPETPAMDLAGTIAAQEEEITTTTTTAATTTDD